ncbi:MAG TPA: hypothetical protein VGP70_08805 [Actinomadura sp.]|nr:hypothetical protein [Actinomadura sp.]
MAMFGLLVAALIAGCGPASRPPAATTGPYAEPAAEPSSADRAVTAADELVLRWRLVGGIAGRGGPGTFPDFSLYGDGRAIVPKPAAETGLREYRLRPAALRRLIEDARAAGLERSRTAEQPGIADAFTMEITFGRARTRIAVAGPGESDRAVRFARERLDPSRWAPSDQAAPVRPYEAARLAVLAVPAGSMQGRKARPWPIGALGDGAAVRGERCTILSGREASSASRLAPAALPGNRWSSAGKVYVVRLRPLLPDEGGCADVQGS